MIAERATIILQRQAELLKRKQAQYATTDDLANFRKAAALLGYMPNEQGCYEALKAMMAKHIAHIYNNDIGGCKVVESLEDIINYCTIAIVQIERWEGMSRK